ncbi:MAG: 16S rRNA (adenine(1518)-N(6)/adenine(1519)-N(6))-dimethyltransferase RsmA [Desulfobacula sp.]|nr:16S rRNA (adenine(1518)-N(6)/adenine(1519)-N(6))-dimethyltransferase RsmA [Desulfobacula sp.]
MTHPGQLLKEAKLYAGKELGQNFLSDTQVARKIIEKTGISKDTAVLEIGPGLGALTIPIAQVTSNVIAVEKDSRLINLLRNELSILDLNHVEIINKDVLKLDIKALAKDKKLVVIGNLPYNISSQILFKLVEDRACVERAFLMFQKQLAARIKATPGGRDYSRLSAVVQYASTVSRVIDVGPSCFFPRPDVDSTILGFEFFSDPDFDIRQEKILFSVIKAAFSQRRKTLKNSLAGGELGFEKSLAIQMLEAAGIDVKRRAETLSVDEFKNLTRSVLTLGLRED